MAGITPGIDRPGTTNARRLTVLGWLRAMVGNASRTAGCTFVAALSITWGSWPLRGGEYRG